MTSINSSAVTVRAINAVYKMTGSRRLTGELVGISGSTVTRVLKNAGKSVRRPGRPSEQLAPSNLVTSYWMLNQSLRMIASRAGCAPSTVAKRMALYGIPTRSV